MNAHLVEITYRPCTDRRGSRVVLTSHRFEKDRISDGYSSEDGQTFEQGRRILEQLGYSITAEGESKRGYFCAVAEFMPLREALADFKASPGALRFWTVEFTGRKVGAIGAMGEHAVLIEARTIAEARAKLYETHEHISRPTFHRRGLVAESR